MKKRLNFLLVVFLLVFAISFTSGLEKTVCLNQEITAIKPSSVEVGEDFIVSIELQNCGEVIAKDIKFKLEKVSPHIIVKQEKIIEYDSMQCANCKKLITFNMRASDDAPPGDYVIRTELEYGSGDGSGSIKEESSFSINVESERAELNIASVRADPMIPREGEHFTSTIRVENFGKGDANSVKGRITLPFEGTKDAFLGKLSSNDDGPLIFTLIPEKSGTFDYQVEITYKDDYGEHTLAETLEITVISNGGNLITTLLITLTITTLLIVIIILVIRNRKKEEEITKNIFYDKVKKTQNGAKK